MRPVSGTGDLILFESRIVGRMDVTITVRRREELVVTFAAVEVEPPAIMLLARERSGGVNLVSADWVPEETRLASAGGSHRHTSLSRAQVTSEFGPWSGLGR